jgi:hypothetical protein
LAKNKIFIFSDGKKFDVTDENFIQVNIKSLPKLDNLAKSGEPIFISFSLSKRDLNQKSGKKISKYLKDLRDVGINFKITKPLPRCLFNSNYLDIIREFNIPQSCKDCLELFTVKEDDIIIFCKILDNKSGSEFKYINNRNQVYELLSILSEKNKVNKICESCLHFIRKNCNGYHKNCFFIPWVKRQNLVKNDTIIE